MSNKIIPATTMLLSLLAAPAFSDDENVDCFYEAHASHPACSKGAVTGEASFSSIEFNDNDSVTSETDAAMHAPRKTGMESKTPVSVGISATGN